MPLPPGPGPGRPKGSRNRDAPRRDFERLWLLAALDGNDRLRLRLEAAEQNRLEAESGPGGLARTLAQRAGNRCGQTREKTLPPFNPDLIRQ